MKPKAYSYIRWSTPGQTAGDSLRRQLEGTRAWAEQNGVELDETMRDPGVSAYRGDNRLKGALSNFIAAVEAGKIERGSYLVIESLDRMSRQQERIALEVFLRLVNADIQIVTLTDGHVYRDPDTMDLMRAIFVMSRAHEESRLKGERVGKAWRNKKDQARIDGKAITRSGPTWIRHDGTRWVEIEEFSGVVRRMFELAERGIGANTIAKTFNLEGVPSFKHAKGWQASAILGILRSRTVIGEYQPMEWREGGKTRIPYGDPIPGYYPAIITPEQFHRVRTLVEERHHAPGHSGGAKGKTFTNILSGIVFCGHCGGTMHFHRSNKDRESGQYRAHAIRCGDAARGMGCNNRKRIAYPWLETAVLNFVREIDLVEDAADDPLVAKLTLLERRLAEATTRVERLIDLLMDSENPDLRKRFNETSAEKARIEGDIARQRRKIEVAAAALPAIEQQETIIRAVELMSHLRGDALYVHRARINEAIKSIVGKIKFYDDGEAFLTLANGRTVYQVTPERVMRINDATRAPKADEAPYEVVYERKASAA